MGTLQNYGAYLSLDLSAFEGSWVAIFNDRVIAHGSDPKTVYSDAMGISGNKRVMLTKVPSPGIAEIL